MFSMCVCVCVGGRQSGGEESHDPSSVFLQLYHGSMLAQDTPLLLPNNEVTIHSLVSLNSVAGPLIKQRGSVVEHLSTTIILIPLIHDFLKSLERDL